MKKPKKSLKKRFVTAVAGGLVSLLTFLPSGCGSLEKVKKEPVKGYVETGIVSHYVVSSGTPLLKDSHKSFVSLRKGPLSGYALYHTERETAQEELDLWGTYSHKLNDKLSLNGILMTWMYPNKELSKHNYFLVGGSVSYDGPVKLNAGAVHLFAHEGATDGETYFASASKSIPLSDTVSLCPEVIFGATRDMFGKSGPRHITPGISVKVGKGNMTLNAFLREQFSLNKDITDSFTYGGVSLGCKF